MNTAKTIKIALGLATILPISAQAMLHTNTRAMAPAALERCEQTLRERYQNPEQHRIYRRPATSIKTETVTFWMNSVAQQDGKAVPLKTRCVADKSGKVLSLKVARGRWY